MPTSTDHAGNRPTDYDFVDFEERDTREQTTADRLREMVSGLPRRPGTQR